MVNESKKNKERALFALKRANNILAFYKGSPISLSNIFNSVWHGATGLVKRAIDSVKTFFQNHIGKHVNNVNSKIKDIGNRITNIVVDKNASVKDIVNAISQTIENTIHSKTQSSNQVIDLTKKGIYNNQLHRIAEGERSFLNDAKTYFESQGYKTIESKHHIGGRTVYTVFYGNHLYVRTKTPPDIFSINLDMLAENEYRVLIGNYGYFIFNKKGKVTSVGNFNTVYDLIMMKGTIKPSPFIETGYQRSETPETKAETGIIPSLIKKGWNALKNAAITVKNYITDKIKTLGGLFKGLGNVLFIFADYFLLRFSPFLMFSASDYLALIDEVQNLMLERQIQELKRKIGA